MDERGGRIFGEGDGELDARAAVRIRQERKAIADGLRSAVPARRFGSGDVAAVFLLLAFALGLVWLLWPVSP